MTQLMSKTGIVLYGSAQLAMRTSLLHSNLRVMYVSVHVSTYACTRGLFVGLLDATLRQTALFASDLL
jgi:hypothetical protein